jgi:hypothetical protein
MITSEGIPRVGNIKKTGEGEGRMAEPCPGDRWDQMLNERPAAENQQSRSVALRMRKSTPSLLGKGQGRVES